MLYEPSGIAVFLTNDALIYILVLVYSLGGTVFLLTDKRQLRLIFYFELPKFYE